jgi:peroxiredoxin
VRTRKPIRMLGMGASVVVLLASGCATTYKVRTGSVHGGDLKPGSACPDFTFLDQDGRADTFSHVRGVVTLVVFPDDPEWPNCTRCKEVVDLAVGVQRLDTPVVVVSVRTPNEAEGCSPAALHRCPIDERAQLVALCDHQGRVRDLFGPNAVGKFFVVGPDGWIAARGTLTEDLHALEAPLREAVRNHQREVEFLSMPD